jgi:hypothetical protein
MALKKVNTKMTFVNYEKFSKGDILAEGYYLGTQEGNYGRNHVIKAEDGETLILNSAGQLNFLLASQVSLGDYIRVDYDGKEILKTGRMKGKEAHSFVLLIDSDKKIAVESQQSSSVVLSDDDDLDQEVDQVPYKRSAVTEIEEAPMSKASPEDILNKYRRRS